MRKIFLCLILMTGSHLSCEEWRAQWVKGSMAFDQENYAEAEAFFSRALAEVEKTGVSEADYVFIDRAKACFHQKKYVQTLRDAQRAIGSPTIKGKDLSNAYFLKYLSELNLGMDEEAIRDYQYLVDECNLIPKTEFSEDYIVIRNVPDCKCYIDTMKKLMILTGDCEQEADIAHLKSGTIIVKRKKNCECD